MMNKIQSPDSRLNQKTEILIDSYPFHGYIASIIDVPEKGEIEYRVKYDTLTLDHLKNFNHYEKEVRNFLEKYVI